MKIEARFADRFRPTEQAQVSPESSSLRSVLRSGMLETFESCAPLYTHFKENVYGQVEFPGAVMFGAVTTLSKFAPELSEPITEDQVSAVYNTLLDGSMSAVSPLDRMKERVGPEISDWIGAESSKMLEFPEFSGLSFGEKFIAMNEAQSGGLFAAMTVIMREEARELDALLSGL